MFRKFLIAAFSFALSVFAFVAMSLFSTPARACESSLFNHNGSIMAVEVCEGVLVIKYKHPRSSLLKHGVISGTELFRGQIYVENDTGKISGLANVFLRGCGSRSYEVNGGIQGSSIIMTGQAPVRRSNCKVRKYRNDRLLFTPL